jgi:hypothetical protein
MRHTDVRRDEHEIKRNAKLGRFTKPSNMDGHSLPLDHLDNFSAISANTRVT